MSSIIVLLWVVVPAALFLAAVLCVMSIGYWTNRVDLRSESHEEATTTLWLSLATVRGLNGPRT